MRAVIAEIRGNYAAALLEDGRFVRVQNRGYAVGQRVTMTPRKKKGSHRALISLAAAFVLVAGLSGLLGFVYTLPYAYFSVDVNPSIAFTLNRFFRVLSVEAVNADGDVLLDALTPLAQRHAKAEEALESTISLLARENFLAQDTENHLLLSTNAFSDTQRDTLARVATQASASAGIDMESLTVLSLHASDDQLAQARAQGVTPGKLALVDTLLTTLAQDDTAADDRQYWLGQSVSDIIQAQETQPTPIPASMPSPTPSPAPDTTLALATQTPAITATPTASVTPRIGTVPVISLQTSMAATPTPTPAATPKPTSKPTTAPTPPEIPFGPQQAQPYGDPPPLPDDESAPRPPQDQLPPHLNLITTP